MTEGDIAVVIIQVDLVMTSGKSEEKESIIGVSGTSAQAEFYISKRSHSWPRMKHQDKQYPYWKTQDVVVVA